MKLSLQNFRCHTDKVFEFPKEGLVALSGETGAGKSTILTAIAYALYGKIPGKVKKTKPHGSAANSIPKVELSFVTDEGDICIVRTKPKIVTVTLDDVEYEGDAAESMIRRIMCMNYDEFITGAYIVQRANTSVLSMTPMEQIKFVEVLANHEGVEEFKTMIKERIKECNESKTKKQGELEGLEAQLSELNDEKPTERPETPEEIKNGTDPEEVRKRLAKYEKKLLEVNKELFEIRRGLEKAREDDKKLEDVKKKLVAIETEISVHKKRLKTFGKQASSEEIEAAEKSVEEIKEQVEIRKKCEKLCKENLGFEEARNEHFCSIEDKISNLEKSNVPEDVFNEMETNLQVLEKSIQEYDAKKAVYDENTRIKEEARKNLSAIFKRIKTDDLFRCEEGIGSIKTPNKMISFLKEKAAICLQCPNCNVVLSYDESSRDVKIVDSILESEANLRVKAASFIQEIEENGKKLDVKVGEPLGERPEATELTTSILKIKRIREEIFKLKENLKNEELSVTLYNMKKRIDSTALKLGVDLEDLTETFLVSTEGLILEKSLEEANKIHQDLVAASSEISKIEEQISNLEKQHLKLKSTLPKDEKLSKTIENKLSKLNQISANINIKISSFRELLDSFADYEAYKNYRSKCKKMKKRIENVLATMEDIDSSLEGYYGLEGVGREAEILSLEETVKSINEHARVYLDQMFEDPIVVELSCIKELKTKKIQKLQLNTTILYKGNTYESIEELSGGERQRCDMAFLLAVNDMVGANMILLDECLNNLDATINTEVLSMIRDLCGGNKLILVVSHEAVRGVFDTEVFV